MVIYVANQNGNRSNPLIFNPNGTPGIDDTIDCNGFTVTQNDDRQTYQIDPNGGKYRVHGNAGVTVHKFKDTNFPSGTAGFISAGSPGEIEVDALVNMVTLTSRTSGTPGIHWNLDTHHDVKFHGEFVIEKFNRGVFPATVDIDGNEVGVFQDNKPTSTRGVFVESTATITNLREFISRRMSGYGLLVEKNVTKGGLTKWRCEDPYDYDFGTGQGKLVELNNCEFNGANVFLQYSGAVGRVYSYKHNRVVNEMGLILDQGENFSFLNDWHVTGYQVGDIIYVFVRAGGTHAHFRFDCVSPLNGYKLHLGTKGDFVFDTLANLQLDGPMLQCHRIINAGGGGVTGTVQKVADADEVTFQDYNDCEIDVAAGVINLLGRSPLTGIIEDFLVIRHMGTQVEKDVALPKGITVTASGGGTLFLNYSRLHHAKNVLASSTLKIWDAEYWWTPATDPEEVIISGTTTWDLKRWKIATYVKRWYIKNDGIVLTNNTLGFFDHLVPSVYNAAYYIVFFKGPWMADTIPAKKKWAKAHHRGGYGEYFEDMGHLSRRCRVEGRMSDVQRALWGTPLYHRMFIAKLYELNDETQAGGDAIFQFFWHEGYLPDSIMEKFDWHERAGQDATVQSQIYSLVFAACPYNPVAPAP